MRQRGTLLVLALFLLLSVGTTWPLVLHPTEMLLTRHFDGFAAVWLMDVAPDLDIFLRTDRASWPGGQVLRRADSMVMVLLARILVPLTGPVLLFNLVVLLGPVLTAWAAERFAREVLGAGRPWSVLAGLSFGFSGMSATSVLEGHAYFLLLPWLPLLGIAWFRATGPQGRVKDGLLSGLWWLLCLLSSGYIGILGAILVLALGIRSLLRREARWRPLLAAAALALPLGLLYTLAFVTGEHEGAVFYTDAPALGTAADVGLGATGTQLQSGSSGLLQLVAVRPADDVQRHGIAPVLSMTALALSLLAGFLLPKQGPWRLLRGLGLVGMLLALGPVVELIEGPLYTIPWLERLLLGAPGEATGPPWPGFPNLPWLLYPLAFVGGDVFFHFPYRFAWLSALGLGAVGAAALSRLAEALPGRKKLLAAGLLGAGLVDATLRPGLWWRAAEVPMAVPSAYAAVRDTPGAVLELWPRVAGGATDADLRLNNLSCTFQRLHQRPLVSDCIGTGLARSLRVRLSQWLYAKALEGAPPAEVRARLAELGVGSVVLHPLLFDPGDLERIEMMLKQALGEPVASSTDGGEPVVVYRVQGPQLDRGRAAAAWRRMGEEGW